jgi:hypothetical protein
MRSTGAKALREATHVTLGAGIRPSREGAGLAWRSLAGALLCLVCVGTLTAATAKAASPWWTLSSGARPSTLEPEGEGEIVVNAENVGDANVDGNGAEAQITDTLPAGLRAVSAAAAVPIANSRSAIPCTLASSSTVTCSIDRPVVPYSAVEVRIAVAVTPIARTGELNTVTVSGGEAPNASITHDITVSDRATSFGVQSYSLVNEEAGGVEDDRAGSHPFQQTTTIELNQTADTTLTGSTPNAEPAALPKDLQFRWPAGLIGNPTSVSPCSDHAFLTPVGAENECPASSAIGVATVTVNEPSLFDATVFTVPLFELEPEPGEPARFGFNITEANTPVYIDTAVRTGSDYGVTVESDNITETAGLLSAKVTVWGVPSAASHDADRGWGCLLPTLGDVSLQPCEQPESRNSAPFLSLPTSCGTPLRSTVLGDTWRRPTPAVELASFDSAGLVGCNDLGFGPQLKVAPDTAEADAPAGARIDVHVPQGEDENPEGLASSNIRTASVTLPEGVTVNPAAASGLEGCSEAEIGYLGSESSPPATLHFTSTMPDPACPAGAKLGDVTIRTPLLARPLVGSLYLASPQNFREPPQENPFETLIAMYLVAEDPVSRTLIKLPGSVSLNQQTGQVQASFENTPDLNFEDAEIELFGGAHAALSSPPHCGTYTAGATFAPWSGQHDVTSQASFVVSSGPGGTPCPGTLPFAPSLSAGSTSLQAGAYTPLTTTISRPDGQQAIRAVSVRLPPGLAAVLTGVPLCDEADANAGTCGAASLIGQASGTVGVGSQPYTVTGGEVFLTAGYEGAPFGLSIVTPAIAGPFNLGDVIVRAQVQVNQRTAEVSVTTAGSGPHAIPQMLQGIPLQLRQIHVDIDRPNFAFNPTNCNTPAIEATVDSAEGSSATASAPFRVANCATLHFAPKLTASTTARPSRLLGVSFKAKLTYPTAPWGTQADIAKVKVDLPKQLPSRLSTLHKACLSTVFESDPAACPSHASVGHATVTTPVLPVPLSGPAYFVSHGGEAFPALTVVLQGYGITIDLVGSTYIHDGVTSTTFRSVPDVPFSTFELSLPSGEYSALGGYGDLCATKLQMPTAFVAQNGAEIHEDTSIAVTGCKAARARSSRHKSSRHKKQPA